MNNGIYQHLLTCSRRAEVVDEINDEVMICWKNVAGTVGDPILSGAAPRVNLQHVAYFLLTSDAFRLRYCNPAAYLRFKSVVDETRNSLLSSIRSNPLLQQVRDRAAGQPTIELDEEGEQDEEFEDNNDENDDGGER